MTVQASAGAVANGGFLADLLPSVDATGAAEGGNFMTELLSAFDPASLAADSSHLWSEVASLFCGYFPGRWSPAGKQCRLAASLGRSASAAVVSAFTVGSDAAQFRRRIEQKLRRNVQYSEIAQFSLSFRLRRCRPACRSRPRVTEPFHVSRRFLSICERSPATSASPAPAIPFGACGEFSRRVPVPELANS